MPSKPNRQAKMKRILFLYYILNVDALMKWLRTKKNCISYIIAVPASKFICIILLTENLNRQNETQRRTFIYLFTEQRLIELLKWFFFCLPIQHLNKPIVPFLLANTFHKQSHLIENIFFFSFCIFFNTFIHS